MAPHLQSRVSTQFSQLSMTIPTPHHQRRIIRELTDSAVMKEGDLYFVLSARWHREWERYVEGDDSVRSDSVDGGRPGPGAIDNSELVVEGSEGGADEVQVVKQHLEKRLDYVLVPEQVWKKLHDWYNGGPVLPRKVIVVGVYIKRLTVEVFLLRLKLTDSRDDKQYVIHISKMASVRELYERVCKLLGLEEEKIRIWDYHSGGKYSLLNNKDESLGHAVLINNQDILLEVNQSGSSPSEFEVNMTEHAMDTDTMVILSNGEHAVPVEPAPVTIAGGPSLANGNSTGYRYNFHEGNSLHLPLSDVGDGYSLGKWMPKKKLLKATPGNSS